jgi:SAM-dependent methyltransferase
MKNIIKTLSHMTNLYEPVIIDDKCIIDHRNMLEKVEKKFSKMERYVEKDDTIIDLGCNVGYYLIKFRKKFQNDKKYIGIDDDKKAIILSRFLVKHNGLKNIDFYVDKVENFTKNKPKSDVTILMQLPYPFQFSEYLLGVVKTLKLTSDKIILECGRSPKHRDKMLSINSFENKLRDIMYCELINITPDEDDEYLNMYILTK